MNDITFFDVPAIANKLGQDSSSIRRALLLVILYLQYITALINNRDSVERHNGYIASSYEVLSAESSISIETLRKDMGFLEGRYLIVSNKADHGIKFKLNMDKIFDFIEEARDVYKTKVNGARKTSEENRTKRISNLKEKAKERTKIIAEIDSNDLNSLIKVLGEEDGWFVYLFTHYYKRYTGMDYEWTSIRFNTLKGGWKGKLYRRYTEFGLSRALKEALNDKSKTHLEIIWRERFNPDFNTDPYDPFHPVKGVLDDGLMKRK